MENRRNFMKKMAAGVVATGLVSVSATTEAANSSMKKVFVHHVFFWLKDPKNAEARKAFENGIEALVKVPQIQSYHIGTPVESPREVVDDSFTYSYIAFFKNGADQDVYQTHPIHLKFVEDCQHLWEKVIVYDAIN